MCIFPYDDRSTVQNQTVRYTTNVVGQDSCVCTRASEGCAKSSVLVREIENVLWKRS